MAFPSLPTGDLMGARTLCPILTGPENWKPWLQGIEYQLRGIDAWDYVSITPDLTVAEDRKKDNRGMYIVACYCGEDARATIEGSANLHDMFVKLKAQYDAAGWTAEEHLWGKLIKLRLQDCTNTLEYVTRFKVAVSEIKSVGYKVPDSLYTYFLLTGLGSSHEVWLMTIRNLGKDSDVAPTYQSLCSKLLKLAENEQNMTLLTTTSKTETCEHCKKKGHGSSNCWKLHPEKKPEWAKNRKKSNESPDTSTLSLMAMLSNQNPSVPSSAFNQDRRTLNTADDPLRAFNLRVSTTTNSHGYLHKVFHLDSGATNHICLDRSGFTNFQPTATRKKVWTGKGPIDIKGLGDVNMDWIKDNGDLIRVTLTGVLYVPGIITNMWFLMNANFIGKILRNRFPMLKLKDKGVYWRSDDLSLRLIKTKEKVGSTIVAGGLFLVKSTEQQDAFIFNTRVSSQAVKLSQPMELLHNRLGHLNVDDIKRLSKLATGINLRNNFMPDVCEPCALGKITRDINHAPATRRAKNPFDLIHMDLIGPITPRGFDGTLYSIILTDDAKRATWNYNIKSKSDWPAIVMEHYEMIKTQTGLSIKAYRADFDPVLNSTRMTTWGKEKGISWEFTQTYTPEQDGVSERANRTCTEKLKCLFAGCTLPKKLWPLGLSLCVYLKNRSPTKALDGDTPIHALLNEVPDLSHLRVFGCTAYVHIPKEKRQTSAKFEPRGQKCAFVGYDKHLWLLWDGRKVIRSKDVVFDERKFYRENIEESVSDVEIPEQEPWLTPEEETIEAPVIESEIEHIDSVDIGDSVTSQIPGGFENDREDPPSTYLPTPTAIPSPVRHQSSVTTASQRP